MKIVTARKQSLFIAMLALCNSVPALADDTVSQGYIMTVYSDMAHGQKVLDGAETRAIQRLSRNGKARVGYLEGQVNLCVAYAKTRQAEKAVEACDSAIESSLKQAQRLEQTRKFGRRSTQVADTGLAIALTNRGVLHAIAGEENDARAKFEMAIDLESTEQSARANLALLESRLTKNSS